MDLGGLAALVGGELDAAAGAPPSVATGVAAASKADFFAGDEGVLSAVATGGWAGEGDAVGSGPEPNQVLMAECGCSSEAEARDDGRRKKVVGDGEILDFVFGGAKVVS